MLPTTLSTSWILKNTQIIASTTINDLKWNTNQFKCFKQNKTFSMKKFIFLTQIVSSTRIFWLFHCMKALLKNTISDTTWFMHEPIGKYCNKIIFLTRNGVGVRKKCIIHKMIRLVGFLSEPDQIIDLLRFLVTSYWDRVFDVYLNNLEIIYSEFGVFSLNS